MGKELMRFDWAIKRLLRNKANFVVLEGFLSELLFEDIKIKKILESESNQPYYRYNHIDIFAQNLKDELIVVEVQSIYEIDYLELLTYGISQVNSENLDKGQKYTEVKKVISVNIVFFNLGQGKDYIYKGNTDFRGLHNQDVLNLSETQKRLS